MHEILEPVALTRDIPVAGLRCGDIGAVVEVHEADAYEVEFVVASGRKQALLTR
jgi:acetolactate synthase regulatory subunit